ncbi:MAG TPA: MFS transporter [Rhizomicrobium sp.]|nr:MFS transporter [Rhizomicrobium sp.]
MDSQAARRFPLAAPDGLLAALLLSFLATAGIFYVNIMPALVSGLIDGLHFSEKQAGFVASANVYGAAFGALTSVFFVKRIAWRSVAIGLLCALIVIDVLSTMVTSPTALIAMRFVQGTVGGMEVGTAFSVIARTRVPERTFGMLLVVQFGLGGVGVMFLPRLVASFGTPVLFLTLALFSLVTLAMIPFLADYKRKDTPQGAVPGTARVRWAPLGLALLALLLFQAGNMALAAYMIELGRFYGLKIGFISNTLGVAGWIGALGSLLVVFMGTRLGRVMPLAVALVLTVIGNALFHFSASQAVYAGANIGTAITWAFVLPYLLGMCAAFDPSGQTAALGGFCSKMGLATGPLVAGLLLGGARFSMLIDVSVAALALSAVAALVPAALLDRT